MQIGLYSHLSRLTAHRLQSHGGACQSFSGDIGNGEISCTDGQGQLAHPAGDTSEAKSDAFSPREARERFHRTPALLE